jgi:hypothetical protein
MGIKISSLPNNALPYTGSEEIPLVQNGQTRAGTLSSFVSYLSGALLSDSELRALSGNWQNTYTTFTSNSANYAVKNVNNNFTTAQTVNGTATATSFILPNSTQFTADPTLASVITLNSTIDSVGSGSTNSVNIGTSNASGVTLTNATSIGANALEGAGTVIDTVAVGSGAGRFSINGGDQCVFIGKDAGYNSGAGVGTIASVVAIGQNAAKLAGQGDVYAGAGNATNIVAVGNSAGQNAGIYGAVEYIVAIGENASSAIGSYGSAENVVTIGSGAGTSAGGNYGSVIDMVAIGSDAGITTGNESGNASDVILIGQRAGGGMGSLSGLATNIIAIGKDTGFRVGYSTTSTNNIYIGLSSGHNKQGSRNTFVGDLTNTSPTSATSLSGCIAIGYGATPTVRNTIAIGSASTPLSVVPGGTIGSSLSGLKIMINGIYYTIPLLA